MMGPGPGIGHQFRTSNDRNSKSFLKEILGDARNPQRLPRSWAGRIALLVVVLALLTLAALM